MVGAINYPEFTRLSTLSTTISRSSHLQIRSQFVALRSTIKQAYWVEASVVGVKSLLIFVQANITRKEALMCKVWRF